MKSRDKRKTFSVKVHRQQAKCYYCKRMIAKEDRTLDHIIPKSLGGRNTRGNIVMACKECNQEKGSLSVREFMQSKGLW